MQSKKGVFLFSRLVGDDMNVLCRIIHSNAGRILVVFVLFIASCQMNVPDGLEPPTGLILNNTLVSNGIEREYHLFVPEDHNDRPVVILLHGGGGSHDSLIGRTITKAPYKVWLSLAEQNNFFIAVPNGTLGSTGIRMWNDCRIDASGNPDVDDVRFIEDMLTKIKNDYDYDPSKVYVVGTSNGGHMTLRLAQEIPEKITAFAVIVASISENSKCADSSVPVSALFMNGTEDPILPFEGGEMLSNRGLVFSTQESIDYWIDRNETSTIPIVEDVDDIKVDDGCSVIRYSYENGNDNTEVVLYEITEGGHTEPSVQERYSPLYLVLVGNQNGDFEMAEEVWGFFKAKSK